MNDIVKRTNGSMIELSEDLAARLLAGIEDSQAKTMVAGGGKDLIKLAKGDGSWSIGQADTPMQIGSKWWINLLSICHGYICWSNYPGARKNERLGEVMCPMSEPKPPKPGDIDGFPFKEQRSFEAICLNGEDAGTEVMFKNGSTGTLKGMKKLEDAIKAQIRVNWRFSCPVVQFKSERYKHGDYGWIWNPIFEVVDWANQKGDLLSAQTAGSPKPESEAAPVTSKPRAKPALVEDTPEDVPPPPPPRPAQRRRPPLV